MSSLSLHRLISVENKFTAGTAGRFSITIPSIGFIPDTYVIRSISYDGVDNLAGSFMLSSSQLGGVIGMFISASSQGAITNGGTPTISTPGTIITNCSKTDLGGQSIDFVVSQRGTVPVLLSGSLAMIIECIKYLK